MRFRNALLVSSLACAVAVASAANSKTIGMVAVASLAASAAGVLVAAITLTRRQTRSAANPGSRSG
jgi:hypothetical protein